jgi:hypothetical protein
MATTKSSSLTEEIVAGIKPVRSTPWHRLLPQEVLEEVQELRRRFRAGEFALASSLTVAQAISDALSQRGYAMPKTKQVAEWLRRSD